MKFQRDYLMLVTSAAVVATPALGQTAPDFSGIWVHPSLPGFEQPLSGPGPVRNRGLRRVFETPPTHEE